MKLFFDTNKLTMPQQVAKNKKDIEAQHEIDVAIDEKIDKEIQDRTDADIGLQADINDLKDRLDSLGNVFTLKGSVATTADLPASNNNVGDVYYVEADSSGYVWIDDDGTERWEQLGLSVDLSAYATKSEVETGLAGKQDNLTPGTNISIIDNVISASGGANNAILLDGTPQEFDAGKRLKINGDIIFTTGNNELKYKITIGQYGTFAITRDFKTISFNQHNIIVSDTANSYIQALQQKSGTIALIDDCKKYIHKIRLTTSSVNGLTISVQIYTSSSEEFTLTSLAQWLSDNGYTSSMTNGSKNFIAVSNKIIDGNEIISVNGIYSVNGSSVYLSKGNILIDFANSSISIPSGNYFATTITDAVTEI